MRATKTTTINVGHVRSPVERAITKANAKAQSLYSEAEMSNLTNCVQCETNFVVGSSGSSVSLCSECFVNPPSGESSLKQKRKAKSASKSKNSDKRKRSAKVPNTVKVFSSIPSPDRAGLGLTQGSMD